MNPKIGVHGVQEIKDYPYGNSTDRKIEDFDFPCSDTFREYYETQFGDLTSHLVTSKSPKRQQPSHEMSDLKPIRTIIRENKELNLLIGQLKSDVSGLKKAHHTHDKKTKSVNPF